MVGVMGVTVYIWCAKNDDGMLSFCVDRAKIQPVHPACQVFRHFFAKKTNVPTLAREGLYDLHKRCINSQGGT